MSFNAYDEKRAKLAEDFINTYDLYLEQPEHLQTPDDLRRFLNAHGIKPDQVTLEDLEQTRSLRSQLRKIWTAPSLEESIRLLNPLLEKVSVGVQVTHDSGESTHLEFKVQPTNLVSRLGAECALGIAAAVQHHGLERLRACAAEPCRDVFIDTSRNKSRRFCSDRCANRYNIAAFRDRHQKD
jgi:predicted RNA-binding Zn ribbon-like protein